jgi:hypothetical protein
MLLVAVGVVVGVVVAARVAAHNENPCGRGNLIACGGDGIPTTVPMPSFTPNSIEVNSP